VRGARDREPAEAPLWARAEAEAAAFAPTRITPPRRAPWVVALATVVAIGGLIALASATPAVPGSATTQRSLAGADAMPTAEPAAAIDVRPPALGSVKSRTGIAPVTLLAPVGRDGAIVGAVVPVDGELEVHASTLRIALEGDRFTRIDSLVIDTTDPNGQLRPDTTPTFHVELELPSPRPIGQLWVVITAYDRNGDEIGSVRSAVLIGPATPA
jgi:hypothetical protein